MAPISARQTRAACPEILDRVLGDAERFRQLLERGRSTHLDDAPSLTMERADRLVEEVRESRAVVWVGSGPQYLRVDARDGARPPARYAATVGRAQAALVMGTPSTVMRCM